MEPKSASNDSDRTHPKESNISMQLEEMTLLIA